MREKKNSEKKLSSEKRSKKKQSHEFETMSQIQNRYGKGRKHNGSDGSMGNENFSNH